MFKETFLNVLRKTHPKQAAQYDSLLEWPRSELGDLALPCFTLREGNESPAHAAVRIAEELSSQSNLQTHGMSVQAAGPYVNITFSAPLVAKTLTEPKAKKANEKTQKVLVLDYSSPNIGKPFGIGHLRSTMIGASLKACYEYQGWRVEGINHLGDWGTQFGNMIVAYLRWGENNDLSHRAVETLYALYVRFHAEAKDNPALEDEGRAWFAKLEQGDAQAKALWQLFREKSIQEFDKLYRLLGISFEHVLGESFYEDKMPAVLEAMREKKILTLDEGAWIVDFTKHGIEGISAALIIKSNNTTTYVLRDVASLLYRKKTFNFDKALYEVGAEQALHFKQVFAIAKLLGYDLDCEHVSHGLYMFPEGKMSTRKGNIIFIEDVIEETIKKAESIIAEKNPSLANRHEVARQIALGAIVFQDLRTDRIKTVTFSWEKMLSFDGETGPYVQYAHARIASILRKAPRTPPSVVHSLRTPEELQLAKHLLRFEGAVEDVVKQAKPHILCRYVLDLTQLFNTFYVQHKVIQEDEEIMMDRLALVRLVQLTIQSCLLLLHVPYPDEM